MQRQFPNGSVFDNSLKHFIKDLKQFQKVDFILNEDEIQRLQKYPRYRQTYENYRLTGNPPDGFGVVIGISQNAEQFFIVPKSFVEKLSVLLQKKYSELTSEEKVLLMDDSSETTIDPLE